jgi:protein-tyrosine phosphatase
VIKVLFVCLGNICRSPTAQGAFERLVASKGLSDQIKVDSAGTAAYHLGEPPDARMQRFARRRGMDLSRQRARMVTRQDCQEFDYIVAMDRSNLNALRRLCPADCQAKIGLFMDYAPHLGRTEVPDPYYGGASDFEEVIDLVEAASAGLLQAIQNGRQP